MDLIDELLNVTKKEAEEPETESPSKRNDLADLKKRVVKLEAASDCDCELLADLKVELHEIKSEIHNLKDKLEDFRERLADVEDYVYSEDDEDLCDGEDCDECDLNEECGFYNDEDEDEEEEKEEDDDFSLPKVKVVAIDIDAEKVGKILVNLIKELGEVL